MDLPQQVCRRLLLAKKSDEEKVKRETRTQVSGDGRRHGDSLTGFVLEARGSSQSLQMLRDLIAKCIKCMPNMLYSHEF